MKFLTGEFSGRNVIPLNILYDRGTYNKPDDDVIDIIYKDLDNNKKYVETIINPKIEIWIVKPEFRTFTHMRDFIPKEQCNPYYVHYKTRFIEIGKLMNLPPEQVKSSPYICQIDMKIEHFYLMQFINEYNTDAPKRLSLGYLDIENDIIQVEGFPTPGEAPINAVTYIDGERRNAFTFILTKDNLPVIPKEHPDYQRMENLRANFYNQIEDFKRDLDSGEYFKYLHSLFDDSYGEFNYHLELFSEEIDLLNTLWTYIRNCDNDYALVWNLPYDAMNLIERPKTLGYDTTSLLVDDRFMNKDIKRNVSFVEDTNPLIQKRRHESKTYTTVSFIDQMVEYVGIRSGFGKLASAKLNVIAKRELKDEKLDYSEEANIKTLFYINFKKFITYNIKDVMLQFGIENKTHDMDTVYDRLYINFVLLNESFVTTAVVLDSLRNFAYNYNLVMGTNKNKLNNGKKQLAIESFVTFDDDITDDELDDMQSSINDDEDDKREEKYEGAFVMNTLHMLSSGFKVMGRETKFIHDLMADLDIGSEYPTAIIIMNASNETIVAKVLIDNPADVKVPIYRTFQFKEDELRNYKDNPSNFLVEVLSEHDPFDFGEIFLRLPSPDVILKDIGENLNSLK